MAQADDTNSTAQVGHAQVGHAQVWRLAGPIMISNLTVPLLGAVDTAVVGHLPQAHYLGAVAVGAMIFNFIYWVFVFLRKSTTGLTAQAYGTDQPGEVQAHLARAVLLAGTIGLALLVLQWPISAAAFYFVEGSAEVEQFAQHYFTIRIWGAPAAMANFALLGWFVGIRRTRYVLTLQLLLNGINIVLDLVFVVGLGWGVEGVAVATLIAEYSAVGVGLWLARTHLTHLRRQKSGLVWPQIFAGRQLRRLLSLNRDIFLRTLCLVLAFAFFTAQGARQGDVALAANAVLMNFTLFMAFGLDGFANAAEALIGGAVGSRDVRTLRHVVKLTAFWGGLFAVAYMTVYFLFGSYIILALTSVDAVVQAANHYKGWAVILPVIAVWSFLLDGIFVGATRARDMRNAMATSLAIYLACYYLAEPLWGNNGLWLALTVLFAARGVTLALRYPALERSVGR
ncbi:MAG: MATE family efflux transporter [Rhodospirillaceae bacterium]|jgi:MATE family multidrug resistance protein|nr:MATE family efflux transporter [Rhodospirillaceae bacterium]MBT4689629.1 MATE family efflux transporter [Rhodospirillaceae bacterium]MBT5083796.1 MATE family efflux transporter [Rhodospirillaceae bacterium]MBT5523003.1 MATE family efflux transporter [Rhodospirillaceae bacterium]MBT5880260.1 MATE family efflux transporter [Rhodospirillaceae bacterium]